MYKQYSSPCLKDIIEGLEKNLQEKQPYYRELLFDKSLRHRQVKGGIN
ncbi:MULTISPECIES: hypothetical protein [unclassified Rickettsia]|nr:MULTISPECIES: hypothetical protein [unclassified Rickettsia]